MTTRTPSLAGAGSGALPVSTTMIAAAADKVGVCQRPLLRKVTDRATGHVTSVPIPCGSTRASVCPACADRARRLRMHQCREGWHLVDDPLPPEAADNHDEPGDLDEDAADADLDADELSRRVRSTRRLPGFPDLPQTPTEHVSVGRTFTDPKTGATFRPSMFVTLTLPSYGRITPGTGVPVDPGRYDYRRAALDALFFARLVDRWWQNLRRCAGYRVQYFATVEAQRRLAPHLHTALRGAIPRQTLRQVTAATYCALWWPPIDTVRYDTGRGDPLPAWDPAARGYYDPATGALLPTWDQALDDLDADQDAAPMHVARFGGQVDIKGILGGTEETRRAVSYLCKYLTKAVAETYTDPERPDPAYQAHIDRLHDQARWLPCSESCANWLRYGVTPKDPGPGMLPGMCPSRAHDRECLGLGGRRVLVSRHWTGKTLTEHRADRADVVRAVLEEAGIEAPEARRLAADILHTDGQPRFVWEDIPAPERDYAATIAASVRQRRVWREQYEHAKQLVRAGPAA
jgi:hypothetical protein